MTNTSPYPNIMSELEVVARIALNQASPDLSSTSIPGSLKNVMERCWERDPKDRINISEVLDTLRGMVSIWPSLSFNVCSDLFRNVFRPRARYFASTVRLLRQRSRLKTLHCSRILKNQQ